MITTVWARSGASNAGLCSPTAWPPRDYVTSRAARFRNQIRGRGYVRYVVEQLLWSRASSLTNFSPGHSPRAIAGMLENYDFIDDSVMAYFKRRLPGARDAISLWITSRRTRSAARAGGLHRSRSLQMRRLVGAARCAASRLCDAGVIPLRLSARAASREHDAAQRTLYRRRAIQTAFTRFSGCMKPRA